MTVAEAVKGGFAVIHRQWQLIVVHAILTLINVIGIFVLVGVPLIIALIVFGIDIASIAEAQELIGPLKNPIELFTKYLGLFLVVLTFLFLYIVVVTTLWIYVYGGSAGIIGRTILDPELQFSTGSFFTEAKRLFLPLMWFLFIVGLLFFVVILFLVFFGAVIAVLVSFAEGQDSTLALFFGIFFTLVFGLATVFLVFVACALTLYGIAALFFKGEGAVKSFQNAFRFLWDNQKAFWLYVLLVMGYTLASFILVLIVYPFQMIPFVGSFVSLPFQFLSSVAQSYFGLVLLAVIFVYYHDAEIKQPATVPATPAEGIPGDAAPFVQQSLSEEGISRSQASEQEEPPSEKDGNEQT